MAYADVLVTAEVNIIAGFYVGCFGCNTVGRQIPTCISSVAYFFQLAYVYSVSIGFACCYAADLAVCSNSHLTQLSACGGDLAVVAACLSIIANCNTALTASTCTVASFNLIIFRCQISSHRRRYACTGHYTCSNQHCQQLFRRAAFTAMIFRDFGDNNVCVARLTPNYFEYFVHQ